MGWRLNQWAVASDLSSPAYEGLVNEAPRKVQKDRVRGSRVGEYVEIRENGASGEGVEAPRPAPHPGLYSSSLWLFLSDILS